MSKYERMNQARKGGTIADGAAGGGTRGSRGNKADAHDDNGSRARHNGHVDFAATGEAADGEKGPVDKTEKPISPATPQNQDDRDKKKKDAAPAPNEAIRDEQNEIYGDLDDITFSQLVAELFERESAKDGKRKKDPNANKAAKGGAGRDVAFTASMALRVILALVLIAVVGTLLLSLIV